MLALRMIDQKDFTEKLFLKDTFHRFAFVESSFTTFITYNFDGMLQKDFFDNGTCPQRRYSLWREVQPQCYNIIRGKRTPLHFKIVFQMEEHYIEPLLRQWGLNFSSENIFGLYLNIQYDGKDMICTTGTSLKIFTLDKTLDHMWDQSVQNFFQKYQIVFEDITH